MIHSIALQIHAKWVAHVFNFKVDMYVLVQTDTLETFVKQKVIFSLRVFFNLNFFQLKFHCYNKIKIKV